METLAVPRLIISGVKSGVGKTLFGIGLAHELRRKKISLSCGIIGPYLAQASIYRRLAGRYARCFDERLLSSNQILAAAWQASLGADLLLIDGHAGLYDGDTSGSFRGSDAEIAAILRAPVVLLVDARGFGSSLAALFRGYVDSASGFEVVSGVLSRTVNDPKLFDRNLQYFNAALALFGVKPLIGQLPELTREALLPGFFPFQQKNTTSLSLSFFVELGSLVSKSVDIDKLIQLASQAPIVEIPSLDNPPAGRRSRIAITDDSCFSLGFQDNIDLLRYYGAEIVTFSPLADSELPEGIGGLYVTGAYLHEYGDELGANKSIKTAIKNFAARGGVVYSEGSGTAYLCRTFRVAKDSAACEGVGVIPAEAIASIPALAYRDSETIEDSILGRSGLTIKSIETNEWRAVSEDRMIKILRVTRSTNEAVGEGFSPGAQIFGTFLFPHFGSNPEIAKNIVEAAQVISNSNPA